MVVVVVLWKVRCLSSLGGNTEEVSRFHQQMMIHDDDDDDDDDS